MEQLEFFDVPSPCVRVCATDKRGYCVGCMRNRQERFNWLHFSTEEKLYVIKLCQRRYRRKQLESTQQIKNKNVSRSHFNNNNQTTLF